MPHLPLPVEQVAGTAEASCTTPPAAPLASPFCSSGRPSIGGETGPRRHSVWLRDHGHKLFDIFSSTTLDKVLDEVGAFDFEFYTDQKCGIDASKARKFARKLSAYGSRCGWQTFPPW